MAQLFKDFKFLIISSADLPLDKIDLLKKKLAKAGLKGRDSITIKKDSELIPLRNNKMSFYTHIISNTIDFVDYALTEDLMIPVVKDSWVEDSINEGALLSVRCHSPDPKYFFTGIHAHCVSSIPIGDRDALYMGIESFGGSTANVIDRKLTHLIATDMDEDECMLVQKFNELSGLKVKVAIVLPQWIEDCLNLRRKLDATPYSFPNPAVASTSIAESSFDGRHLDEKDEIDIESELDKTNSNTTRTNDSFLKGKHFFLGEDLGISKSVVELTESMIRKAGGSCMIDGTVEDLKNAKSKLNCYVGKYRSGEQYITASKKLFHVGSMQWLYWMMLHERWISPYKKLLHYPIPKEGVPGMENCVLTVTNYTGDSRLYLQQLIKAMGGQFTKSLKMGLNTHLLVAKPCGQKYQAAQEWNITCVNHLWIEESFAKWELQNSEEKRYRLFPKESNLTHIIGQTPLDRSILATFSDKTPSNPEPAIKNERESELPQLEMTNSVSINSVANEPEVVQDIQTLETVQRDELSEVPDDVKVSLTPSVDEVVEVDDAQVVEKEVDEVVEVDDVQVVEKEVEKSHSEPAIVEVKDQKNINTIKPQKASSDAVKTQQKRAVEEVELHDDKENIDTKKKQKVNAKPYDLTAILTGCDDLGKSDLRLLSRMGVKIVDQPTKQLNCIIAPTILRTEKFLKSLSMSPKYIISPMFVSDVLGTADTHKKITDFESVKPDINQYKLSSVINFDSDVKVRDLFVDSSLGPESCISNLIMNSNSKLLSSLSINLSSKITGGSELIGSIIKAFGCKKCDVVDIKTSKFSRSSDGTFYLLCNADDAKLIEKFKKSIGSNKFRVVEWNWIVRCIFNTSIVSDKYIVEES
ncbi:hypothetical protein CANARDRAFT_26750 [[Candida] arabinofermentans NRRL YB-2248]|uniref:BRCT domain-containing protein n=1 Tax=[Candida] arabinofermentans NRRL YB-2248 TaxID=983967 RepID=A0A1E4T6F2_9ASCO|nr:hypothetical protein CANARDRAFT_26750 [[Candida] arabinofermentans NRRL YB-2248]